MFDTALPSENAIAVHNLHKRYGAVDAVNGITFTLKTGEVLGFLGPNGAGKSTTMKMVAGFVPVTSGAIEVFGEDIQQHSLSSRQRIGYLPEGSPLYGEMTVAEFLSFIADIRRLSRPKKRARINEVIEQLDLELIWHQRIETLSKGFKRRVGLAQAILHDPDLLLLDEPTDGLDPNQKFQVRELIRTMGQNKAIIISTHLLEEVDAVCDRAVIINRGRIVFDGTPPALHALAPEARRLTVRVRTADLDKAQATLANVYPKVVTGTAVHADDTATLVLNLDGAATQIDGVSAVLDGAGIRPLGITAESGNLDAVFRKLTTSPA